MLYIICEDDNYKNLISKLLNKYCFFEPKTQDVKIFDVNFKKLYLPNYKTKIKSDVLKLMANNNIYLPKTSNSNLGNISNLDISKYLDRAFNMCLEHLLNKAKTFINDKVLVIVDADYNYIDLVKTLINQYNKVLVITNEKDKYQKFSEEIYFELGAVIQIADMDKKIYNSLIIDINNVYLSGVNNVIITKSSKNHVNSNIHIHSFYPTLKNIYLKEKPENISQIEFYALLKEFCQFKDEVNINNYNAIINGKTEKYCKILEKIKITLDSMN